MEKECEMSSRWFRALVFAALIGSGSVQAVAAAGVHVDGSFTQHFGGRNGDGPSCPPDILNCGTGMVAGYGRATDAFAFDANDDLTYTITLAGGSSVTAFLSFADASTPGNSGNAPGDQFAYGNPDRIVFDAEIVAGTGVFTGATGTGTLTLRQAGNVDQLTASFDLSLP
jgi:hypothetical protein